MALDANGSAGGLGILWNPNQVSLTNFVASRNMLSGHFHILGTSIRGVVTNVYGPFQLARKTAFLEEIRNMEEWVGEDYWLMGGDFNLIRSMEEKKGGIRVITGTNHAFNRVIEDLHLVGIQTPNDFHTWQNKRSRKRHIVSPLDRFLVLESILSGEGDLGACVMPGVATGQSA